MRTSSLGYALIRREEDLSLTVKSDTGGKQEIGYGHDVLQDESFPDGIDEAGAERLLGQDVAKCERALNPLIAPACTQNQYDALIDFTYECGPRALAELVSHGWSQIPTQLPRWVHAHVDGELVELAGMVSRRRIEALMFSTPD